MNTDKNEHASEVLNDLLRINNDRITGYQKARKETKESDLMAVFESMESESEKIASTLSKEVSKLGGTPDRDETTNAGKIYRVWMDVKATFSGSDRKSVLSACEYGEDAAQNAYKTALKDEDLPSDIISLIKMQQAQLKLAHDSIKSLRDRSN